MGTMSGDAIIETKISQTRHMNHWNPDDMIPKIFVWEIIPRYIVFHMAGYNYYIAPCFCPKKNREKLITQQPIRGGQPAIRTRFSRGITEKLTTNLKRYNRLILGHCLLSTVLGRKWTKHKRYIYSLMVTSNESQGTIRKKIIKKKED